jgi:hypothetical protein
VVACVQALERQRFTDAVNSAYYTEPDFIKSQLSNTNDLIRHLRGRSVWEKGGGQEMGSKAGGHPASGQSKSHSEAQSHECIGIEHYLQVLRSKNIIPHVVSTHEAIVSPLSITCMASPPPSLCTLTPPHNPVSDACMPPFSLLCRTAFIGKQRRNHQRPSIRKRPSAWPNSNDFCSVCSQASTVRPRPRNTLARGARLITQRMGRRTSDLHDHGARPSNPSLMLSERVLIQRCLQPLERNLWTVSTALVLFLNVIT